METSYLELEIIERPAGIAKIQQISYFKSNGTIGRAVNNSWCLPDPKRLVSAEHAYIRFDQGDFWLRDISRNGTFLNKETKPIGRNQEVKLSSSDCLRIGSYVIRAKICRQDEREEAAKRFIENINKATAPVVNQDALSENFVLERFFESFMLELGDFEVLQWKEQLNTAEKKAGFLQLIACLFRELVEGLHHQANILNQINSLITKNEKHNPFFIYDSSQEVIKLLLGLGGKSENLLPPLFSIQQTFNFLESYADQSYFSAIPDVEVAKLKAEAVQSRLDFLEALDPVSLEKKWFSTKESMAIEVKKKLCWDKFCEEFPKIKMEFFGEKID